MQELQPLRNQRKGEEADAREVTARLAEATNEPKLDGVDAHRKDDWNRRARGLGCQRRTGAASRDDDSDLTAHKVGREGGKSVVVTLGPAKFDPDVLSLLIASFV